MVLKFLHFQALVLCSSTAPHNYEVINNHVNHPLEKTTPSSRPIPPPPNSFYKTVLESSSKTGLRLKGISAPHGLGGGALDHSLSSGKQESLKGLTGGPDVTTKASSDGPKTVEEAAQYMMKGVTAPLIDRAITESHDALMEKVFMESTGIQPEETSTDKPMPSRTGWNFVRNPMPWIKKTLLGSEAEEGEPEGFREVPYYHQPKPGMDKVEAHPSFYHGEETMDIRRKYRLEQQAVAEVWEMMSTKTEKRKPLHALMNNTGASTRSSSVLRQAAEAHCNHGDGKHGDGKHTTSEQNSEPKNPELETLPLHRNTWFKWIEPLFRANEDSGPNQTLDAKRVGVIGNAALFLLFCSFLLNRRYDFIGDSKPPIDAFQ